MTAGDDVDLTVQPDLALRLPDGGDDPLLGVRAGQLLLLQSSGSHRYTLQADKEREVKKQGQMPIRRGRNTPVTLHCHTLCFIGLHHFVKLELLRIFLNVLLQ